MGEYEREKRKTKESFHCSLTVDTISCNPSCSSAGETRRVRNKKELFLLFRHTETHSCCRARPGGLHQELGITPGDALSSAGCWCCTWTYAARSGERHFVEAKAKQQRNKHVVKAISSMFPHACSDWQREYFRSLAAVSLLKHL